MSRELIESDYQAMRGKLVEEHTNVTWNTPIATSAFELIDRHFERLVEDLDTYIDATTAPYLFTPAAKDSLINLWLQQKADRTKR